VSVSPQQLVKCLSCLLTLQSFSPQAVTYHANPHVTFLSKQIQVVPFRLNTSDSEDVRAVAELCRIQILLNELLGCVTGIKLSREIT